MSSFDRSLVDRHTAGVDLAHRVLLDRVADLSDEDVRRPSSLPGWSIGHVLTHLARNAESFERLVAAARRGESVAQYPGGSAQRNGDIEAGALRPASVTIDDLRRSVTAVDAQWGCLDDATWQREVEMFTGRAIVADLPFRRWREVMVHLVDLGIGFTAADWPEEYVRTDLRLLQMSWSSRRPMGLSSLPPAAIALDERTRLAWLLGRVQVPGLESAGIMS